MSDVPGSNKKVESLSLDFPEYMRPQLAAQYLGHSESTLAKLRMRHNRERGPRFAKTGGIILYRRADLDAWVADCLVKA